MNENISLDLDEIEMLMTKAIELAKARETSVAAEMEGLVKIYIGYGKGSRPWLKDATLKVFASAPSVSFGK